MKRTFIQWSYDSYTREALVITSFLHFLTNLGVIEDYEMIDWHGMNVIEIILRDKP